MTDPNHGNSIITRLRLICEEMCNERHNMSAAAGLRSQAENLLPLADVDDIEVIVLREAAAILNGRDWADLADKVEGAAQIFAAEQFLNGNKKALAPFARNTVPLPPPPTPRIAPWEQEAAELMGLTITRHNAGKHVQLHEGTNILAEWWPGKGTTMRGGKRGPLCATGEDLIAWLRSLD